MFQLLGRKQAEVAVVELDTEQWGQLAGDLPPSVGADDAHTVAALKRHPMIVGSRHDRP